MMSQHDPGQPRAGITEDSANRDVAEVDQAMNVPLLEEEVRVERHSVTGGDVPADAFEERDIDIPLRGEEAVVTKTARVREEVAISKDVRERTAQVRDCDELRGGGDDTLDVDRDLRAH